MSNSELTKVADSPVSNVQEESGPHQNLRLVTDKGRLVDIMKDRPVMSFEAFGPEQITEDIVSDVADYYRFIFDNQWEYAYCRSCDQEDCGHKHPSGMRLTAKQVFHGYGPRDLVPKELMYNNPDLPDCECCGKPMKRFIEEKVTFRLMKERLLESRDGYVVLMKNSKDETVGMTYAYGTKDMFGEFRIPHLYTSNPDPRHNRSYNNYIAHVKESFEGTDFLDLTPNLKPDTPALAWNCVAINPTQDIYESQHTPEGMRVTSHFHTLCQKLFAMIPQEKDHQIITGELMEGSESHKLFKVIGVRDAPGFFNEHELLTTFVVAECRRGFELTWQEFYRRKAAIHAGKMTREQARKLLYHTQ